MRSARECVNEAVREGLAPMFKAHKFSKRGLCFTRRVGAVSAYFNVQLSQWNHGSDGNFYLNAGVAFDELFAFRGEPAPATPKYGDCQFMVRLERLDPELPMCFSVDAGTDPAELGSTLATAVEHSYVQPLTGVSTLRDFGRTGWVHAVPWGFPALFFYVLGDVDEARRLVQLQADTFADRGVTFASLAEEYGLHF